MLRIGHTVAQYSDWKAAFDRDPIGRQAHGVRRYRVLRSIDDPPYVSIDLEFDAEPEARAFQAALKELWKDAVGSILDRPEVRIAEIAEVRDFRDSPG